MGQAVTANHVYEAGTVHDSVTAGVEYKDHPARDEDGDGDIDRRFIYGPTVVEVGLNLPGRLTGASAAVIEHLIDDNNPPKPGPVTNPNGEDFLISVGFGTSTPINSAFGARFQHVYRATDASPARNDFEGVVLDLVGLAWSPFEDTVSNTVLNDFSLLIGLGHSENGRGPNTNQVNGIPRKEHSGLLRQFDCNRLEHRQDCCQTTLAAPLAKHVQDNPQPLTTAVVQQGTPYTISSSNLFRPVNAGLNPGGANQYLDYPTFNAGIDPFFGKEDVFSFPYDSVLPMLIEYAIGPNQTPPALNLYRFSPGIQTSVLPRFRIWSQGQHPAAWGVPNWSTNVGGCLENQPPWFRAGEGGPLLRPGSFDLAIEPPEQNNGMPTLFPSDYILPPRRADPVCTEPDPDNGNIYGDSVPVQPAPVAIFGQILTGTPGTATQPPDPPDCGCITRFPEPVVDPASNYYFANGMLVNPLPNFDAWPGPTGIPPTQWAGYGVPPGGVGINGSPCIIPPALGGDNQNPSAVSNEPGMSTPPGIYGDNSRYYMLWKYRKRVSVIESPTLRVDSDRVVFERPIILPPVADVDPAASLAIDIKAGSKLDLAIAALDSGYVRTDEPEFSALVSGDDLDHVYVKFRAAFGVAQGATQPPALESIAIPYRKVR